MIRRFFRYSCEYVMGYADKDTVQRVELIMEDMGITPEDRKVVGAARAAARDAEASGKGNKGIYCGAAIELADGTILTGSNSPLMHASSSVVMKAIKHRAGIPEEIHLLSPIIIDS